MVLDVILWVLCALRPCALRIYKLLTLMPNASFMLNLLRFYDIATNCDSCISLFQLKKTNPSQSSEFSLKIFISVVLLFMYYEQIYPGKL